MNNRRKSMKTEIKQSAFRVRVKDGEKELEIEIPMSERSAIGMESDGTGFRAIKLVEELINKIKEL